MDSSLYTVCFFIRDNLDTNAITVIPLGVFTDLQRVFIAVVHFMKYFHHINSNVNVSHITVKSAHDIYDFIDEHWTNWVGEEGKADISFQYVCKIDENRLNFVDYKIKSLILHEELLEFQE